MSRRNRLGIALCALMMAACTGEIETGEPGGGGGGGGAGPDAGAASGIDANLGGGDLADQLTPQLQELLVTINGERTSRGLNPVTLRVTLICAAERHSNDIGSSGACTHTGSDGSSPTQRVNDCGGGGWTGEIVACGQGTPRAAVDAWLNSPGHRDIMLSPPKREIGVAVHQNFWTAIFDD